MIASTERAGSVIVTDCFWCLGNIKFWDGASRIFTYDKYSHVKKLSSSGFTLLELAAAFAIAALALAAFYQGTLTGLAATHQVERHTRALALARSRLALTDLPGTLAPGLTEGQDNDEFQWAVTIVPGPRGSDNARALMLYDVRVTVRWPAAHGQPRAVSLASRRAGPPP